MPSGILRLSEAASLGLHTMLLIAEDPDHKHSNQALAERLQASSAHLAKVLQRLARAGILNSRRGPGGGFTLGKEPENITLLDIYQAIEGPLDVDSCLLPNRVCAGQKCILGGFLKLAGEQFRNHLASSKLSTYVTRHLRKA